MLPEAQEICDKIALIDRGKLLQYDSIDIINNTGKNTTIAIDFLLPPLETQMSKVSKFKGVHKIKHESSTSFIVEFEGTLEDKAEFLKSIQGTGLKIVSFRTLDSSLESLYMDLVSDSVG